MSNQRWQMTTLEDGPHLWRQAFHLGWVDGQHRACWAPTYEDMSRSEQIAYEAGRLDVVNVIAAGLAVPAWNGSRSGARATEDQTDQARRLIGNPIPPEFEA